MHDDEGRSQNLSRDVSEFTGFAKHNNHYFVRGHKCLVQNNQYDYNAAKNQAAAKVNVETKTRTKSADEEVTAVAKIKQVIERDHSIQV